MSTIQEYETNELRIAIRDEERIVKSPLAERQEGLASYVEIATKAPNRLAERIQWLLDGNYGKGQQLICERATKRSNRVALFSQLIAVYEFRTTRDMARKAWRKWTTGQKKSLDTEIGKVIAEWDKSREME